MIIVEGPDGGGKTTLANYLSVALEMPIADKIVAPDAATVLADKKEWVEENLAQGLQRTIFDRHCLISEGIYGPLLRSTLPEEFQDWAWYAGARRSFLALKPLIIFCLPRLEVVVENLSREFDNNPDTVQSAIEPIYWSYWHLASGMPDSIRWHYDQVGSRAGKVKMEVQLLGQVHSWLRVKGIR